MQQIFINGQIYTQAEDVPFADAMLVNEGVVVLAGTNEEILQMKTEDTEVIDLKNQYVYPTFFGLNENIFEKIEIELKNANKFSLDKNTADKIGDYEVFSHFDAYKKEFLKLQETLISRGITTVQEMGITKRSFNFFKKLSEGGFLKIDIIGYVDIKSAKMVMDDNCKSYRKYKNRFRLGGYHLAIDGKISEIKAWLKKPYKHTDNHCGYGEYYGEQLSLLIKNAMQERKQVVVSAHGDKAVEEFLLEFEDVFEKEKVEDTYRPIIVGGEFLAKQTISKLKKLGMSVCYEIDEKMPLCSVCDFVGLKRKNHYQNIKLISSNDIRFLISAKRGDFTDIFYGNSQALQKTQKPMFISKKHQVDMALVLRSIYSHASFLTFDQEQKGSLENGKQASFLCLSKPIEDYLLAGKCDEKIKVYINGKENTKG